MNGLAAVVLAAGLALSAVGASAQGLIDKGFVHGWNVMVDPQMGNGCLIQTVYEDLSVVRIGYDAAGNRGYFVVFHEGWKNFEPGQQYPITFDLDGERFEATATGFRQNRVPGAGVFFDDPAFVSATARRNVLTVL